MGQLDGKVAAITGGSSGIGRSTALALAAEGCAVMIGGRKVEALESVTSAVASNGGRAASQVMDVRKEADVAALMDGAVREFGRLDIMVNNAGVSHPGGIVEGRTEQWREMLETNILALLIGCRESVRAMKSNEKTDGLAGQIVNISSVASLRAEPQNQVYSATKAAVNMLSEGLRQELQDAGIRVTVVLPGATLTNFARNFPQEVLDNAARFLGLDPERDGVRQGEYLPQDRVEQVVREHPGILLSADDIARAVVYAVTQPPGVRIDEVVVRPRVGISLG